jgi:hypothetical protein
MTPFRATALACGVAVVALVAFAASLQARTVTFDRGGNAYDRFVKLLANWGEEVRVVGFCASACTFYIALPNVCTATVAKWLFHGPKGGGAKDEATWVNIMAALYPEPIRTAFLTDYQFREVILSGAELIRVGAIKECSPKDLDR